MAYAYRVTKAFKRVGDDGERQFSIGDKLVLDRPAKSLSHLELTAPADDSATVTVGDGTLIDEGTKQAAAVESTKAEAKPKAKR